MLRLFPLLVASALLVSCTTPGIDPAKIDRAIYHLDRAVFTGDKAPESVLTPYEALHRKYPNDARIAGGYADALSRLGRDSEAAKVLRPFLMQSDINRVEGPVFMAYMRLLTEQGYLKEAERGLRQRLTLPVTRLSGAASAGQISNQLGVVLTRQGRKEEARQALELALSQWNGFPGVVERNLALLQE